MFISMLAEMYELIDNNPTVDEILDYIFFSFMEYIPYDFIHMTLRAGLGPGIESYYSRPDLPQYKSFKKAIKIPKNISRMVPDSKLYVIANNFTDYLSCNNKFFTKVVFKAGIKSAVLVPVFAFRKQKVGVMMFSSVDIAAFNVMHAEYACQIAEGISKVISKNYSPDKCTTS